MNFFNLANSLNISILKPLILCESPSAAGWGAVIGTDVGTAGGIKSDVVGGAMVCAVGILGGNGGVEIVGGATLGGTTVVGFAVGGPTAGILGGIGIGEAGLLGGTPEIGGPVGMDGMDGIVKGTDVEGGPLGKPGTVGAVGGIPGVELGGGGGGNVCTSPLIRSLLCVKLSARLLYSCAPERRFISASILAILA